MDKDTTLIKIEFIIEVNQKIDDDPAFGTYKHLCTTVAMKELKKYHNRSGVRPKIIRCYAEDYEIP